MLSVFYNTQKISKNQVYEAEDFRISKKGCILTLKKIEEKPRPHCPNCGGRMHIYDHNTRLIKDMPSFPDLPQYLEVSYKRYRCPSCGKTITEDTGLNYPGTRISYRAAEWIKCFLRLNMTVKAISSITGIHWDTVRFIHQGVIDHALKAREEERKASSYRPRYLAVDEFAMHKGHSYATCVMDLELGEIIWVGKGRSAADFSRFFEETDPDYLKQVEAFAMDMNAAYNRVVEQHLPHAKIVYDRFHMQAQYGRDVLGSVRLQEAEEHREKAKDLKRQAAFSAHEWQQEELEAQRRKETAMAVSLKKLRWPILRRSDNLGERQQQVLEKILSEHVNLMVCYAMKEEMCRLFELKDPIEAEEGWCAWFEAARSSKIEALINFGRLKQSRLDGLIEHARHPISTGRLEGMNNKIKVCKRIAYGFRDDKYFFSLIRYLTLPGVRYRSHTFP